MALLSSIIARSVKLRQKLRTKQAPPHVHQNRTLKQLLEKAQYTSFGKHYNFSELLNSSEIEKNYQKTVPYFNYNSMHDNWWYRCLQSEENVSWPGMVKYFALSSGTSESASKHIPVTTDMIKSIKKVGFKQFFSMTNFEIPTQTWTKGILMLGGTTSLFDRGDYYEGDMSG